MKCSYRDLLEYLKKLEADNDSRLDDTLTVYDNGEYYPADILEFEGDDVLDDGHLFITSTDFN